MDLDYFFVHNTHAHTHICMTFHAIYKESESEGENGETWPREGETVVGKEAPPTSGRVPAWQDEDDEEIRCIC